MRLSYYDGAILGQRAEQQDSVSNLELPGDCFLAVLADGMGGRSGGQIAGKTVCTAFRQYFHAHPDTSDPGQALLQALHAANQAVRDIIVRQPDLDGLGSTVIALLIRPRTGFFSFISVGDSPLYCLQKGLLVRLNANHACFEELKELVAQGRMSMEQARTHPERHAITSAVMGRDIPLIDQQNGRLCAGDVLLLASDGVQTLDDSPRGEIAALLHRCPAPAEAGPALLRAIEDKNHPRQDNATLILLTLANDNEAGPDPGGCAEAPDAAGPDAAGRPPVMHGRVRTVLLCLLALLGLVGAVIWQRLQAGAPPPAP